MDFVFAGHMHNAMLPPFFEFTRKSVRKILGNKDAFGWGLISPEKSLFPKNTAGLYQTDGFALDISKGYEKVPMTAPKIFHLLKPLYKNDIEIIEIEGTSIKKKRYY